MAITARDIAAASGGMTASGPIGVPADYQPVPAGPVRPDLNPGGYIPQSAVHRDESGNPTLYMDGDEWNPASQSPDVIAEIQRRMVGAGLLTGSYRIGVWDSSTRSAYRELLGYANALGIDDGTALDRYTATGMGQQDATPRAPLTVRLSHPDDIKAALRATFKDRLGQGNIDPAKLDAMVAAYQGNERSFQQQAYNAAESGGTVTEPPSADTFADIEAKKADPTAYDSRKVVGAADYLSRKLRGEV